MTAVGVILGSAFGRESLDEFALTPVKIDTARGPTTLYRAPRADTATWVLFRHGMPHRLLPNQIPYRAHAAALREVGVGALLVTSSVGLLAPDLPLYTPMLVRDIITLDNRLPDGSACTMFTEPSEDHAHLVLSEGLISPPLNRQLRELAATSGVTLGPEVVFGYVGGPRSKTRAENEAWARLGAEVNSMTVAPEIVLACELGIPCAALVIGHKRSVPGSDAPGTSGVDESLVRSRAAHRALIEAFVARGRPVPFGNHLYRYRGPTAS